MITLEEIIPNTKLRVEFYKLMILNEQVGVIENRVVGLVDPSIFENSGVYCGDDRKIVKFDYDVFNLVEFNIPIAWKDMVVLYQKNCLYD